MNSHVIRHWNLNPARLPIPPLPRAKPWKTTLGPTVKARDTVIKERVFQRWSDREGNRLMAASKRRVNRKFKNSHEITIEIFIPFYQYVMNLFVEIALDHGGLIVGNMPHRSKKCPSRSGIFNGNRHNETVAVPLKKPDDTGYPKYPARASADVPAGAQHS